MTPGFWKNKRVLITGHTGFKGSWLSLWLQELGAQVSGYALPPPTQPSLFELAHVSEGMTSVIGDVRDLESLQRVFAQEQPEIVIHMAAQALVRASYEAPVETYATNVMGTVHVLEAAHQTAGMRVVLIVTSDKCYENREWLWGYRENEPMGGHDPYSSSKGCAELVTTAYRRSFLEAQGVAVASARAGNVIGGGDWARDRLVPDVMRAFLESRPVVIRNPKALRPWQHVLDPLHGYLLLAERLYESGPEFADAWNFGPAPEDTRPVGEIVEQLVTLWGDRACWEQDRSVQPHEAHTLKLDASKARTLLGWQPKVPLNMALEWISAWYKGYQAGEPVSDLTRAEIARFSDLLSC
ncbi:MAG TPA: CDP-glucose 4,6-dehydratase [Chthonomonadaceae bacterium]|nr:CDP-glucose 4,6-dehydratase [Chthonomonadaceae bacterium]